MAYKTDMCYCFYFTISISDIDTTISIALSHLKDEELITYKIDYDI